MQCGNEGKDVCCKTPEFPHYNSPSSSPPGYEPGPVEQLCPKGEKCINYRRCASGVQVDIAAGYDPIGPTFNEVILDFKIL